jgi:hypothetical protein
MCSICLDDENKNKMVETPCHHFFHKECLDVWLKADTKSSCPYCRQEIKLTVEHINETSCNIYISERELNENFYKMISGSANLRYST